MSGDEMTEEDFVDGCDLDFCQDSVGDEESDLFVLFADALDPQTPTTVSHAANEWQELFK